MDFNDLLAIHRKYLYIEDGNYLRMLCGLYITSKFKYTDPAWILIKASPSDLKTEELRTLKGPQTYYLSNFTSRTLISGANPKDLDRSKYDLVPKLNHKLVINPDFSTILSSDDKERNQIFSQLRDVYDGYLQRGTGGGVRTRYEGLRITFAIATTKAIDAYQNEQTLLGSRHLTYGLDTQDLDSILDAIDTNKNDSNMREELNQATVKFLESIPVNEDVELPDEYRKKIGKLAQFLAYTRCGVMTDRYTREVVEQPSPEKPGRIYKMMLCLYKGLKNVPGTTDDDAYAILKKIAWDSSTCNRIAVITELLVWEESKPLRTHQPGDGMTMSRISDHLRVGINTVKKELNILYALGLVCRYTEKEENDYYKWAPDNKLRELVASIGGLWKDDTPKPPEESHKGGDTEEKTQPPTPYTNGVQYTINNIIPPLTPTITYLCKPPPSVLEVGEKPQAAQSNSPLHVFLDIRREGYADMSADELRESCLIKGLSEVEFAKAFSEALEKGLIYFPHGQGKDKPVLLTEKGGSLMASDGV